MNKTGEETVLKFEEFPHVALSKVKTRLSIVIISRVTIVVILIIYIYITEKHVSNWILTFLSFIVNCFPENYIFTDTLHFILSYRLTAVIDKYQIHHKQRRP